MSICIHLHSLICSIYFTSVSFFFLVFQIGGDFLTTFFLPLVCKFYSISILLGSYSRNLNVHPQQLYLKVNLCSYHFPEHSKDSRTCHVNDLIPNIYVGTYYFPSLCRTFFKCSFTKSLLVLNVPNLCSSRCWSFKWN